MPSVGGHVLPRPASLPGSVLFGPASSQLLVLPRPVSLPRSVLFGPASSQLLMFKFYVLFNRGEPEKPGTWKILVGKVLEGSLTLSMCEHDEAPCLRHDCTDN